jgi:hypothetical protein
MKRTYFRERNAEHGLQELWKRWELGMVLEKRGKHFVQKMVGSTSSPTENLYLDNCLKKRRERQWY